MADVMKRALSKLCYRCIFSLVLFGGVFFFGLPQAFASSISTLAQIKHHIQESNLDLKLLQHNSLKAQAQLNNIKGLFYQPHLEASFDYQDNQKQPTNPFQSARTQDAAWNVEVQQNTPFGIALKAGAGNTWSKFFQSEPVNPLLPFPASFNQPSVYLDVSVDLVQNFLGYTSRKEVQNAKIDLEISKLREQQTKNMLYLTAANLFIQHASLDKMIHTTQEIIAEFGRLERDVTSKNERNIAEISDVYKIRSLIRNQRADLLNLKRSQLAVEQSLIQLLGLESSTTIAANTQYYHVYQHMKQCEDMIHHSEFEQSQSTEVVIADRLRQRGINDSKIYLAKKLPDVTVDAKVSSTGTDPTFSGGFNEVGSFDRPVYQVGVNFSWPLSPLRGKASKQFSQATRRYAETNYKKVWQDKKISWDLSHEDLKMIKSEHDQVIDALWSAQQQMQNLRVQYDQGRLSLFQITEEKLKLLQTQQRVYALANQRFGAVVKFLQEFDGVSCELY